MNKWKGPMLDSLLHCRSPRSALGRAVYLRFPQGLITGIWHTNVVCVVCTVSFILGQLRGGGGGGAHTRVGKA